MNEFVYKKLNIFTNGRPLVALILKSFNFYLRYISIPKITIKKMDGKGDDLLLLSVFNRLINITKENEIVQNFIKELSEFIEENFPKSAIQSIPRKEQSLIQELLEQNKLTTRYRDKMHVERRHILEEYAEQTADKGAMYYIYNKDDDEINTYHLCICDKKNSRTVIEIHVDFYNYKSM